MGFENCVPKALKKGTPVQVFLKKNFRLIFWERQKGIQNEKWMKGIYLGEFHGSYDIEINGERLFVLKPKCILVRSTALADNMTRYTKKAREQILKNWEIKKIQNIQKELRDSKYNH